MSMEYAALLEREKELGRRYNALFTFMQSQIKESQVAIYANNVTIKTIMVMHVTNTAV